MGKNQDTGSGINIPDPPHCDFLNRNKWEGVMPFIITNRKESRIGIHNKDDERRQIGTGTSKTGIVLFQKYET
jgi:hypothetical protein